MAKRKSSSLLAFVIAAGVCVWVLSSYIIPPSEDEAQVQSVDSDIQLEAALSIESRQAHSHRSFVTIYGATEPNRQVALKAETQGSVISIPAKEGQMVKKGDIIIKIDERDRRAKYAQAQALLKQRDIEYNAAKRLQKEGFQTEIRLAEAKTRLEEARVNLRQIDLDLQYTKLRAPFDGLLEKINVEVGDFVGIGVFGVEGAIASMVDHDPLLLTGQVSEKDRPYMAMGTTASGRLNGGQQVEGKVTYLASVADTASRTFRIEVEIPNPDVKIPAGVTAELQVPSEEVMAFKVSPSVLNLDDKGDVGVKILDENNTVQFVPVKIVEDAKDGMWISGLPASIRLITLGHAFVNAGQQLDDALVAKTLKADPAEQG
ncbi:MAG: efflux RND transporter periplasmic adaptor subunit [Rickettsiales bacterium]|nr:efflux RND transporter periplasmic adaptor subunit [Rickettsiales bacterium]